MATAQYTALKFYAPGIQHEPKQRVCLVHFGCLLTYGQFLRIMHLSRPVHDRNPGEMFGLETPLMPITMAILGGSGLLIGPVVGVAFLSLLQEVLWTQLGVLRLASLGLVQEG